jgi:hypothetical protein
MNTTKIIAVAVTAFTIATGAAQASETVDLVDARMDNMAPAWKITGPAAPAQDSATLALSGMVLNHGNG